MANFRRTKQATSPDDPPRQKEAIPNSPRRPPMPPHVRGDLQSKHAIIFKAILFLIVGCLSGGLLLGSIVTLRNVFLLALTIWSFCRFYYFAFYVIEHYVDSSYRYRGLVDLLKHYWRRSP